MLKMCTLRNAILQKVSNQASTKIYLPITVCTEQAVNTIIQAAEANEDQTLFFGIKDLDLIAKEFKYRECCYKDFI